MIDLSFISYKFMEIWSLKLIIYCFNTPYFEQLNWSDNIRTSFFENE